MADPQYTPSVKNRLRFDRPQGLSDEQAQIGRDNLKVEEVMQAALSSLIVGTGDITTVYDSDTNQWSIGADIPSSDWDSIEGKPSTFPPSSHTHVATDLTSGTLADARLSNNVPLKNSANSFASPQTMPEVIVATNTIRNCVMRWESTVGGDWAGGFWKGRYADGGLNYGWQILSNGTYLTSNNNAKPTRLHATYNCAQVRASYQSNAAFEVLTSGVGAVGSEIDWTSVFKVQRQSGNVGFGQATPTERIDCVGNAIISGIIYLGGKTSNEISMRRSGTTLQLRNGDNSADANVSVGELTLSGGVSHGPRTKAVLLASTPNAVTGGVWRITDAVPPGRLAYPDGSKWRWVSDDSEVV